MAKKTKDAKPKLLPEPQTESNAGQPTKYKPEYCEMLIEHMSKGFSYETFAAVVNVDRDTIYNWEKLFVQFSDAKKKAFAQCQFFWENTGAIAMMGGVKNFSAPMWIFNMKNRFKWHDNVQVDLNDKNKEADSAAKDAKISALSSQLSALSGLKNDRKPKWHS